MMQALNQLPGLIAAHLQLTLVAMAIALSISLPLGVLLARSPRLRGPALAAAGVLQTIPSLALLALMVPVMAAVHVAGEWVGLNTPVLGFLPAVAALSIYGILPVLRNTVTGLTEVDPKLVEAARGLGMTESQVLWQVQLPLAAPILFAGIRTASVWVVGTATLATPVGQKCLGDLIFGGLQTRSWDAVLLGCVAAAGLALLLDALVGALERAKTGRTRRRIAVVGAVVLGATVLAPAVASIARPAQPEITVGAKGFTEQFILARLLKRRLEASGYRVTIREGLGSTIAFDALGDGGVDLYVDYSGTVWANHMGRDETASAQVVMQSLTPWLQEERDVRLLGPLGFENAYAIAVRQDVAEAKGWKTLHDLARDAPEHVIGADYEFFQRPEWTALQSAYGLSFRSQRTFDPTFMYDAVQSGEADAISAFSSDGRIAAYKLTTLEDPEQALPPYDAILLLAPRAANDAAVVRALQPLIGAISIEQMREANRRVDQEGQSTEAAAKWLEEQVSTQPSPP
ncbi:MAG: ABC transporter permease/substrate-binding protein [Myxococcota bacterium]